MKLPRYKSDNSSGVVSSNRSLTTGTQTGGAIADIGALALSKVAEYGAMKNNHEAKLRRLDINTNKSLSDSMMFGKTSEFENSLETREDFLTPENWLLDFDKQSKGWEKEFKVGLDEQTWKEYQPLYYQKFFESKNKVVKAVNNQKLKNAGHAFNQAIDTFQKSVENSTSLNEMEAQYELFTEIHLKDNVKTNLFDADKFNEAKDQAKQFTNVKYTMFQATEGLDILSPNGSKEVDWNNVVSRLKNKEFKMLDIDGNELTVDDELRKSLIKDATEKFTTQDSLHTSQKQEKDRNIKMDFTNKIVGLEMGTKEGEENAKTFLNDLKNSNLEPKDKLTLKNAYLTALSNKKSGKATYDSVQGQQTATILTYLVGSGVMDTDEERQAIWDALGVGLIKNEKAMTLLKDSLSLTKDRNAYKKGIMTRATSMLLKEVGAGEGLGTMLQSLGNTQLTIEQRQAMLQQIVDSGQLTKEAYEAMNNMFRIVAEGERKGFTYENMLMNNKSSNYIMNDIITAYKEPVTQANLNTLKQKISGIQADISIDKNYYIMPSEYFINKTASNANLIMPQKLEGEDIFTYIKRAKKLVKTNDQLPSSITGKTVETLDLSDLNIVPTFGD